MICMLITLFLNCNFGTRIWNTLPHQSLCDRMPFSRICWVWIETNPDAEYYGGCWGPWVFQDSGSVMGTLRFNMVQAYTEEMCILPIFEHLVDVS